MKASRVWILGASDPEMELVEKLLRKVGETVVYAVDSHGERVRGGTAYRNARAEIPEGMRTAFLVECDVPIPEGVERVVLDHHRPGDPGYGRPPIKFFPASSVGQVVSQLAHWGLVGGVPVQYYADDPDAPIPGTARPKLGEIRTIPQDNAPFLWAVFIPGVGWLYVDKELVLAAAADHCLAAAYRGECPGVDPDELMRWRAESRARFQRRSVDDVLANIERARQALREAPDLVLKRESHQNCDPAQCEIAHHGRNDSHLVCYSQASESLEVARDMRGRHVPELPEAAARDGVCFVADGLPDSDGRVKIVCQGGSPAQIEAFMRAWAPAQGLVDVYGDPARGIAGAYKAPAPAKA